MRQVSRLLSVVVLVLAGTLSLLAPMRVLAQAATPDAAASEPPPLLVHWAELWSSEDPDELVSLYTEDAVYTEVPTGIVSQGRDEIAAFINDIRATYPGVQVIPRAGFRGGGGRAVLEADFVGTSATGASFSVPFVAIFEFDGKQIVRQTDYFDLYGFMSQLGTLPGSGAASMAGTPTP
jgi:steroid delta-isomerase-like uncharacterized protein